MSQTLIKQLTSLMLLGDKKIVSLKFFKRLRITSLCKLEQISRSSQMINNAALFIHKHKFSVHNLHLLSSCPDSECPNSKKTYGEDEVECRRDYTDRKSDGGN